MEIVWRQILVAKRQINIRLNERYIRMLDEIAEAINDTKTGAIEYAIFISYDQLVNNRVKAD